MACLRLICLALIVANAYCQEDDPAASDNLSSLPSSCSVSATALPRQIEQDDPPKKFIAIEHGLQIFYDYEIPCDGFVTEFRFLSSQTVIWGLHLAVFRPAFVDGFRLVNQLYLNGFSTNVLGDTWVIARPRDPISVKQGDFIGMYYDEFNVSTSQGRASIRSYSLPPAPSEPIESRTQPITYPKKTNTLVFTRSADGMVVNKTILYEHNGQLTYREPALYVMLSRFPNPEGVSQAELDFIVSGGKPSSSDSNSGFTSERAMQFRDLKCNLLPNLKMWDYCGKRLAVRYYYEIRDRSCKQFLGCDTSVRPGQTPPAMADESWYYTELSWNNNFATKPLCESICRDARYLRRGSASSTLPPATRPPTTTRYFYTASNLNEN